jgi:sulfhydrogenase subunit alpha
MGLELKKLGNTIQETIGGRAIHPVNAVVGGFGKIPSKEQLWDLREQLEEGLEKSLATFRIVSSLDVPDLCASPNVYAALANGESGYSLFGDKIILSTGETKQISAYKDICRETVVPHSHAKHSLFNNNPFMVGALARIALNGNKLSGQARSAFDKLDIDWSLGNPFHNNIAQAVELIYSIEKAIEIIDQLLTTRLERERPAEVMSRPGFGAGAVEAPRGTLYHSYRFDEAGRLAEADVITPTAQNLANVEKDLRACAESSINESKESISSKLEMIVRAYDPCISCAVHLLEVNFK